MTEFLATMTEFFNFIFTQLNNFVTEFLMANVLGQLIVGGIVIYLVVFVLSFIIDKAKR